MVGVLVMSAVVGFGGLGLRLARRAPTRSPASPSHPAEGRPAPGRAAPRAVAALLEEIGLCPETAWPPLALAAAVGVAALGLLSGPLLAVATAGALVAAPRALDASLQERRTRRRDEQLPAALERLAAELRSGRTLGPALVDVAAHAAAPLGIELRTVAAELQHGASVTAALERWGEGAAASTEVRLTASALALGSHTGGNLARSVDEVAATLRERRELRAEARALATQARASAVVLVLAPPAFTLLVSTIEPGTLHFLLGSAPGLACLIGGVALDLIGARWMARIVAAAG